MVSFLINMVFGTKGKITIALLITTTAAFGVYKYCYKPVLVRSRAIEELNKQTAVKDAANSYLKMEVEKCRQEKENTKFEAFQEWQVPDVNISFKEDKKDENKDNNTTIFRFGTSSL
jgi:hypothetical protein